MEPNRIHNVRSAQYDGVTMRSFDNCPVCGGEVVERQVQKLLRGGGHTASITVTAKVCPHCAERLYSSEAVKRFEEIRAKLDRQETSEFQPIGQSFEVN
jgi:YgiT-type zinc finger domain-containing protein